MAMGERFKAIYSLFIEASTMDTVLLEPVFNSRSDQRDRKDSGKKGWLISMRDEGHHSYLIMS